MNFIKNFKAKSPKAFWTIIVVIVALVVVGFSNNNNNGTPFSFSKTPQKMIEDGGNSKAWKVTFGKFTVYMKFQDDHTVLGSMDNEHYDDENSKEKVKYEFTDNSDMKVSSNDSSMKNMNFQFKDLKVDGNNIAGTAVVTNEGVTGNMSLTMTPAS